jgi:ABC-type transport system involved in cytochrome bd biosynthesis fused ATPase/permease subunit
MNKERPWWRRLGTLILTIVSVVWLLKAAGMLLSTSAPVAAWVISAVCAYGLGQIYEVIFDIVVAIADAKSRQHELR